MSGVQARGGGDVCVCGAAVARPLAHDLPHPLPHLYSQSLIPSTHVRHSLTHTLINSFTHSLPPLLYNDTPAPNPLYPQPQPLTQPPPSLSPPPDPEILERRYPVVLRSFRLRHGSGGSGQYRGGDGVVREVRSVLLLLHSRCWERTDNTPAVYERQRVPRFLPRALICCECAASELVRLPLCCGLFCAHFDEGCLCPLPPPLPLLPLPRTCVGTRPPPLLLTCVGTPQVEFLRPMTAGILSERRSVPPFGLFGGLPGQKGLNLLMRSSGRVVNLGGKATVQLQAGDILQICTPGAGGYGAPGGGAGAAGGGGGGDGLEAGQQQQQQGKQARAQFDVVGSVDTYRRLQETA